MRSRNRKSRMRATIFASLGRTQGALNTARGRPRGYGTAEQEFPVPVRTAPVTPAVAIIIHSQACLTRRNAMPIKQASLHSYRPAADGAATSVKYKFMRSKLALKLFCMHLGCTLLTLIPESDPRLSDIEYMNQWLAIFVFVNHWLFMMLSFPVLWSIFHFGRSVNHAFLVMLFPINSAIVVYAIPTLQWVVIRVKPRSGKS